MIRLCVVLCALFLGFGCASEGDKAMWESAIKDLRGDNMQMRGGLSESRDVNEPYALSRYRN
jgi:hypothetical protein